MNGYQIAIIALWAAGVAITIVKHGEPRDDHNAVIELIAAAIVITLYIKAGLFS